jgi:hypothetical protein
MTASPSPAGAYCAAYLSHRRKMRNWSAKAQFVAAKFATSMLARSPAETPADTMRTLAQLDAATDALMERGACADVLAWCKRAEA